MEWVWRIAQFAVFGGLLVFFYEVVGERKSPIGVAAILALAVTAVLFAPLLHLQQWLLRRREKTRTHQHLDESGAPCVLSDITRRPRK